MRVIVHRSGTGALQVWIVFKSCLFSMCGTATLKAVDLAQRERYLALPSVRSAWLAPWQPEAMMS